MSMDRRSFLWTSAALAAMASSRAEAAMGKGLAEHAQRADGSYAVVDLKKPVITLGVVQSRIKAIDAAKNRHAKEMRANLDHMLSLIDAAFYYGAPPDVLFFHEFPLSGWKKWTREEILRFAIEIPGPQTEEIAKKAKQYGCYIVFGAYAQDAAWKNHVLSITTIIGPDGNIVDKHWKARNIKGVFPGFELFTTTIYDVLDQYIEMYGVDAVIPVTRTPLGNFATSSVQREPELFRAMALKGAEIMLRTASGGFTPLDIQATSLYNDVYTAIVNNAASPGNWPFFEDSGSGGTAVYGPDSKAIAEANGKLEQLVTARIPMAEFRARHRQPIVHWEMFAPVFAGYRSKYGPNLFSDYQPTDLLDAARHLKDKSRW